MLEQWKIQYPEVFVNYAEQLASFSEQEQESLEWVLTKVSQEVDVPEAFIINILDAHNTQHCLFFIERALLANEKFESINKMLDRLRLMTSLSDTLVFFNNSRRFSFTERDFDTFCMLALVLANPLCKEIFNKRSRTYSDYGCWKEPLEDENIADEVIERVLNSDSLEAKIKVFYEFFSHHTYRLCPASQKYVFEFPYGLDDYLLSALEDFCQEQIDTISTEEDYQQISKLIKNLREVGGNTTIFDAIKYKVAGKVEENYYCFKSYDEHMNDIWTKLEKPQPKLSDFSEELALKKDSLVPRETQGFFKRVRLNAEVNAVTSSAAPTNI